MPNLFRLEEDGFQLDLPYQYLYGRRLYVFHIKMIPWIIIIVILYMQQINSNN